MTHLSLFSGIGGIDLAAHWAGFRTVAFVEREPFCQKVLAKHWPGVPIYDDVCTVTADGLRVRGVNPNEISLVSGGFPCQPHSLAGLRKGSDDERDLWHECYRIVCEVRPRWFLGENVLGLLSSESGRFFGRVLADLASVGYRVGWGCFGAGHVGARHRRLRVFLVAYSNGIGLPTDEPTYSAAERGKRASTIRCEDRVLPTLLPGVSWFSAWQPTEPGVARTIHGISSRVDASGLTLSESRVKALGNCVVPWQVVPILNEIANEIQGEGAAKAA